MNVTYKAMVVLIIASSVLSARTCLAFFDDPSRILPAGKWTEFEFQKSQKRANNLEAVREMALPPFDAIGFEFDEALKENNVDAAIRAIQRGAQLNPKLAFNWSYLSWKLCDQALPKAKNAEEEYLIYRTAALVLIEGAKKHPDNLELLFSGTVCFGQIFRDLRWSQSERLGQDKELLDQLKLILKEENIIDYRGRLNHHLIAADFARTLCNILDSEDIHISLFPNASRYAIATREFRNLSFYIESIEKSLASKQVILKVFERVNKVREVFNKRQFVHRGVRFRHQAYRIDEAGEWSWQAGAVKRTPQFNQQAAEKIATEFIDNTEFCYFDQLHQAESQPHIIQAKIELYKIRKRVETWISLEADELTPAESTQLFEEIQKTVRVWKEIQQEFEIYKDEGVVVRTIQKLEEIIGIVALPKDDE